MSSRSKSSNICALLEVSPRAWLKRGRPWEEGYSLILCRRSPIGWQSVVKHPDRLLHSRVNH